MVQLLSYVQIALSILLIAGVLIQRSDASLGAAFGGSGESLGRYARRGLEKVIFKGTIIVAVLFALSAFANLLIGR
jgi:protein translocase SecG subunit